YGLHRHLHSFPTRRSSDLQLGILTPERSGSNYRFYGREAVETLHLVAQYKEQNFPLLEIKEKVELFHTNRIEQEKVLKYTQNLSDRKSTRLNSSHVKISYA